MDNVNTQPQPNSHFTYIIHNGFKTIYSKDCHNIILVYLLWHCNARSITTLTNPMVYIYHRIKAKIPHTPISTVSTVSTAGGQTLTYNHFKYKMNWILVVSILHSTKAALIDSRTCCSINIKYLYGIIFKFNYYC